MLAMTSRKRPRLTLDSAPLFEALLAESEPVAAAVRPADELPAVVTHPQAPAAVEPAESFAREVLSFRARWVCMLPLPLTMLCRHSNGARAVITTSRAAYTAARAAGVAALDGRELVALALGTENDRITAAITATWLHVKITDPASAAIGAAMTLGGAYPEPRAVNDHGATVEQVLRAAGLTLEWADTGDAIPPELCAADGAP